MEILLNYTFSSLINKKSDINLHGLLVLLISKAAGHHKNSLFKFISRKSSSGISEQQRVIAYITDKIFYLFIIHKEVENIKSNLQLGNKSLVLLDDFLLANIFQSLAQLRNHKVFGIMMNSIGQFVEGKFMTTKKGTPSITFWEQRNFLLTGSLSANSCQSALCLAGHNDHLQMKAYEFGRNFALAWQASTELKQFLKLNKQEDKPFDLMSAPIILHMENDKQLLKAAYNCEENKFDYEKLHSIVINGHGIDMTKEKIAFYTNNALDMLQVFSSSDGYNALANIIYAIKRQNYEL